MAIRCFALAYFVLGADPQFLKSTLYLTQPLEKPQAIVNVYEPDNVAQHGKASAKETIAELKRELLERKRHLSGASFMEQESDSLTERQTQAAVIRFKLQSAAPAPAFLSARRGGDEVTGLVADLAGSAPELALVRLHELLSTPSTAAAVRGSNVMGSLRGLLASQTSSERVRQLAGSLVANLSGLPVASEQTNGSGSGGSIQITMPLRHEALAASFLSTDDLQQSGSAASALAQYPFAEQNANQAREPNQVNVVFDVPGRGGASFLQQQSQDQKSGDDVPVVNVHVQTLSEPMEPFVKRVADLTTAAERAMDAAMKL